MSEKNMSDEILSLEGLVFEAIELEIKDHIMTYDIWDSEHFCNAYWNITLHLQPWED